MYEKNMYDENPLTSDEAIAHAKSRIMVGCVPALLRHGAAVHGCARHGDLYTLWHGHVPTTIHVAMPPTHESMDAIWEIFGASCKTMKFIDVEKMVYKITHDSVTYIITLAWVADLFTPAPTFETIYLAMNPRTPTFGIIHRSHDKPDIFTALDHLHNKQLVYSCDKEKECAGNATDFLTNMHMWLGRGFYPSSNGQTQRCIRLKISTACSLATTLTPLLRKSIEAFYDTSSLHRHEYRRPKQRGESTYFIAQLWHQSMKNPTVDELLQANMFPQALVLACESQDPQTIDTVIRACNRNMHSLAYTFAQIHPHVLPYIPQLKVIWAHVDMVNACKLGCGADLGCSVEFEMEYGDPDLAIAHAHPNMDPQLVLKCIQNLTTLPTSWQDLVKRYKPQPRLTYLACCSQPGTFAEYLRMCGPKSYLTTYNEGMTEPLTQTIEQLRFAIMQKVYMHAE